MVRFNTTSYSVTVRSDPACVSYAGCLKIETQMPLNPPSLFNTLLCTPVEKRKMYGYLCTLLCSKSLYLSCIWKPKHLNACWWQPFMFTIKHADGQVFSLTKRRWRQNVFSQLDSISNYQVLIEVQTSSFMASKRLWMVYSGFSLASEFSLKAFWRLKCRQM